MTHEQGSGEFNRAAAIAGLNDAFRRSGAWMIGQVMITPGILFLPDFENVLEQVRTFNDFSPEDDDPWGEHDFGAFAYAGERVYWKIDYYDQDFAGGADPLDPECRRILTVMTSDEW